MRMRPFIATLALATVLVLSPADRASAQSPGRLSGNLVNSVYSGPVRSANVYGTGYAASLTPAATGYAGGISGYVPPYSYYAAIPPMQPRAYVGYGNDGFAFHGRPYGHPNDRWSWQAMSAGSLLDRYYDPPVR